MIITKSTKLDWAYIINTNILTGYTWHDHIISRYLYTSDILWWSIAYFRVKHRFKLSKGLNLNLSWLFSPLCPITGLNRDPTGTFSDWTLINTTLMETVPDWDAPIRRIGVGAGLHISRMIHHPPLFLSHCCYDMKRCLYNMTASVLGQLKTVMSKFPYLISPMSENTAWALTFSSWKSFVFIGVNLFPLKLLFIYWYLCFQAWQVRH